MKGTYILKWKVGAVDKKQTESVTVLWLLIFQEKAWFRKIVSGKKNKNVIKGKRCTSAQFYIFRASLPIKKKQGDKKNSIKLCGINFANFVEDNFFRSY